MSRLLIISHTPHHRRGGTLVAWGATVRELDHLASLFDDVVHLAPLHSTDADDSMLPYQNPRVTHCPVPAAGGKTLRDKLGILSQSLRYLRTIHRQAIQADVVHVRCPAAISLLAILLLAVKQTPKVRWIKYAGNWQGYPAEPWSYWLQRWLLRTNLVRSRVTVNGEWPDQPPHIVSFLNPCLTLAELKEGQQAASEKNLTSPVRLLFVGRVEEAKGAGRALQIVAELNRRGIASVLDVVGDGPQVVEYRSLVQRLDISDRVRFLGWCDRTAVNEHYKVAHFLLLPTAAEGWPKVVSEAMAFGAVPLVGAVGSIPQTLWSFRCGRALTVEDTSEFVRAIEDYRTDEALWRSESRAATVAAAEFTYESYLVAVAHLLGRSAASTRSTQLVTPNAGHA